MRSDGGVKGVTRRNTKKLELLNPGYQVRIMTLSLMQWECQSSSQQSNCLHSLREIQQAEVKIFALAVRRSRTAFSPSAVPIPKRSRLKPVRAQTPPRRAKPAFRQTTAGSTQTPASRVAAIHHALPQTTSSEPLLPDAGQERDVFLDIQEGFLPPGSPRAPLPAER